MTVNEIIALFGTQTDAANAADVKQPSVASWKSTGQIPAKRIKLLLAAAQARGINLTPADFYENAS